MRQIKFRGLLTSTQQCIIGDLYQDGYSGKTFITEFIGIESGESITELREVIPETVGQFTGLHDKNGMEIYEGDFLSNGTSDRVLVIWRQDLASFALSKNGWMYDHYFGEAVDPGYCEVIGNIHTQDGGQEG